MKRVFCDLCDEPIGTVSPNLNHRSSYMAQGAMVIVHISFTLENHPTGFGGPPDLCGACTLKLVNEVFRVR